MRKIQRKILILMMMKKERKKERERERDETNKYVGITVITTETKYWCAYNSAMLLDRETQIGSLERPLNKLLNGTNR